ncbi:MAG TPA: flippase-like domain-containing protein [bacterium]|nr:flippase-like domain-containing protein [bacterium]
MNLKRPLIIFLKCIIISIIVFFLVRAVLTNWKNIQIYDWSFNPLLMTLSCLIYFAAYAFLPWIWSKLLYYMGYRLSFGDAWHIYYIGNLGRYIPGKIWALAGMAYMAEKAGIPSSSAGAAAIFAQVYSLLSSFVFFVIFLIFNSTYFNNSWIIWFVPVFLIMAVFFIFPRNLESILNVVLKRLDKSPVKIGISVLQALKIITLYFLSWILFGAAFWILISSIVGWGHVNMLFASGAWATAYAIGFLAFFVPGGLGVREGILSLFFMSVVPVSIGIIIAGVSRLIVTVIEIVCVLISFVRRGLCNGKE